MDERIQNLNKQYVISFNSDDKRWCRTHPSAFWGKTKTGEWFWRCSEGNRKNEDCEIGN